jgi:Mn2+/Fe2+ NRAMP family transporter
LIVFGAGLVLWPGLSLYKIMLTSQVINGILLPPILIFMVLIASNVNIMGKYVNSKWYNVVAWIFTIILIVLTAMLLISTFIPDFMHRMLVLFGVR